MVGVVLQLMHTSSPARHIAESVKLFCLQVWPLPAASPGV